jgi:hypothetical protein
MNKHGAMNLPKLRELLKASAQKQMAIKQATQARQRDAEGGSIGLIMCLTDLYCPYSVNSLYLDLKKLNTPQ